jgi:hypothetical protein
MVNNIVLYGGAIGHLHPKSFYVETVVLKGYLGRNDNAAVTLHIVDGVGRKYDIGYVRDMLSWKLSRALSRVGDEDRINVIAAATHQNKCQQEYISAHCRDLLDYKYEKDAAAMHDKRMTNVRRYRDELELGVLPTPIQRVRLFPVH